MVGKYRKQNEVKQHTISPIMYTHYCHLINILFLQSVLNFQILKASQNCTVSIVSIMDCTSPAQVLLFVCSGRTYIQRHTYKYYLISHFSSRKHMKRLWAGNKHFLPSKFRDPSPSESVVSPLCRRLFVLRLLMLAQGQRGLSPLFLLNFRQPSQGTLAGR